MLIDVFVAPLLPTPQLPAALEAGLLSEAELDVAVARSMTMRFLTGQFDPPQLNPWGELNTDLTVNGPASRALARRVVHEGALLP
jgi:beta-glucosidase